MNVSLDGRTHASHGIVMRGREGKGGGASALKPSHDKDTAICRDKQVLLLYKKRRGGKRLVLTALNPEQNCINKYVLVTSIFIHD